MADEDETGLRIYSRKHDTSNIHEVLATLTIRSDINRISSALLDFDHYTDFMPGTLEACHLTKLQGEKKNVFRVFQQLSLPFVSDRYYTIRLVSEDSELPQGRFRLQWTLESDARFQEVGQGEPLKLNNGFWRLYRRDPNDELVEVAYYIHTDPGKLWGWVVNLANSVAVPDVVTAVKQYAERS